MTLILNALIMVVGAWLAVSPFVLHRSGAASIVLCAAVGLASILLALVSIRKRSAQLPAAAGVLLGMILFLWGVFIARLTGSSAGANEIVVGLVLALLNLVVLPFQLDVKKVEFFNRNGGELATFSQIRMKNDNILAKAVLLGSMPETIYMYPEEICKAIALMDPKVILSLPSILFQGWKRNRSKTHKTE
ncbi:MAG: hypothetical protein ABFD44_00175 [Anaerolineaceae bacterium]